MKKFMKNSYKRKRYYVIYLMGLLTLLVAVIYSLREKRVYKVYIDDRLVGVTAESPEVIEKTYNEVKAKRYAQGAEIIEEEISITEQEITTNIQLVDEDELARRLYVELDEEEPVAALNLVQGKIIHREYPMETIYVEDSSLYVGESRVINEGEMGTQKITLQRVFDEEGNVHENIIDNEIIEEPHPKVIAVGVKEKPNYILPVEDYELTSPFGPRWGTNHYGVDLAVPTGTQVAAAADGVVIQSGWNGGYGISVYVDHGNGIITRYGHLSQAYAQVGRSVSQGEILGLSGSTGNSTGPHLHFEIRIGEVAVNPENYVEIEY